ncbi:MAG: helix-turn-helix transcriptional regulator [Desulfovibrio sp.]|uniref:helix-turn-helix transcriptional regulator n=1 Tax=Desulfovibrio sp. 7SRBS1 TaxID=3378064 RepID=UPI003B3FA3A6
MTKNPPLTTHFRHQLDKGLRVELKEFNTAEDVHLRFNSPGGNIGCSFCLEGGMTTRMESNRSTATITSGISGIWHAPETAIDARVEAGRTLWLDLEVRQERFLQFVEENINDLRPEFMDSICKKSGLPYHGVAPMTPETRMLLRDIMHCPFQGGLQRLYLESKGLGLLLGEVSRHTLLPSTPHCPCVPARHKAEQARELLLQDLSNPPTITDLARQVGMSESSLKRAFRTTFGQSIFSYFQTYRLNQAKALLASGEMNVTEVAFAIGYSNHSHFSRAFKRQFGISPKSCHASIHSVLTETGTNLA